MRSLVVLAPCACVDFIILFQLADLGPGLGLGGLSHFFLGCSRVSVARRARAVCVTRGDYRILFSRISYKHTCKHASVHAYIYIHIFTHTYKYIHTHTYIFTHLRTSQNRDKTTARISMRGEVVGCLRKNPQWAWPLKWPPLY